MKLDGFELELVKIAREVSYYLRKNGASREDAEDIAQDALVKVLETNDVMPLNLIRAWFYKVATNKFRDLYRRQQRYANIIKEKMLTFDITLSVFELADEAETSDAISLVLQQLKPEYSEILLLCYDQGLTHAEIAFLLEIKLDTVNTKLYRARKAFKKCYLLNRGGET